MHRRNGARREGRFVALVDIRLHSASDNTADALHFLARTFRGRQRFSPEPKGRARKAAPRDFYIRLARFHRNFSSRRAKADDYRDGVALIQILLVFLITLKWKISGHCTSAAGLSFLAIALYGEAVIPLTLIIPVIAWSRIRLGRHTLYQTIAGSFLGAVTVIGILYLTNSL